MTEKDKLVDEKLFAYKDRFRESFPLDGWVNTPTEDELIRQIDEALRTGKKVKPPKYKKGLVY